MGSPNADTLSGCVRVSVCAVFFFCSFAYEFLWVYRNLVKFKMTNRQNELLNSLTVWKSIWLSIHGKKQHIQVCLIKHWHYRNDATLKNAELSAFLIFCFQKVWISSRYLCVCVLFTRCNIFFWWMITNGLLI